MELDTTIALVCGVIGAILGAVNTYILLTSTRMRLVVRPAMATPVGNTPLMGDDALCIEITNLSSFEVTVTEVGLLLRDAKTRMMILAPILFDEGPWPRRLKPREAVTVYSPLPAILDDPRAANVHKAYARTACGEQRTAKGPIVAMIAAERARVSIAESTSQQE